MEARRPWGDIFTVMKGEKDLPVKNSVFGKTALQK